MSETQSPAVPEYAVELKNISFTYPRRNLKVLRSLDLKVPQKNIVALMGGSGSGKTTILRLITGQYRSSAGSEVIVNGQHVENMSRAEVYRLRNDIGVLFQFSGLFTDISVFDNVAFPLREHSNMSESIIHDLVMLKLQSVGLRAVASSFPSNLSGGQQRRVALARAVALDPKLMLYDEPFSGLDPVSMSVVAKLIKDLNEALSATTMIITHDVAETFAIADLIYVMWHGEVISSGTPAELRASKHPLINQFVHGEPEGPLPFHMPGRSLEQDLRLRQESS